MPPRAAESVFDRVCSRTALPTEARGAPQEGG